MEPNGTWIKNKKKKHITCYTVVSIMIITVFLPMEADSRPAFNNKIIKTGEKFIISS